MRSPFRLRASEDNLQGVLDELPAAPKPNSAGSVRLPAAVDRDQPKQEELSVASMQKGRVENASRDAVLLSGKKKHLHFRHSVGVSHERVTNWGARAPQKPT